MANCWPTRYFPTSDFYWPEIYWPIAPTSTGVSVAPNAISMTGSMWIDSVILGSLGISPTFIGLTGSVVDPTVTASSLPSLNITPAAIVAYVTWLVGTVTGGLTAQLRVKFKKIIRL